MASAKTVAIVDASYLQTLLGYNARRVSLQVIELFNERMAAYDLSPVDFSVPKPPLRLELDKSACTQGTSLSINFPIKRAASM